MDILAFFKAEMGNILAITLTTLIPIMVRPLREWIARSIITPLMWRVKSMFHGSESFPGEKINQEHTATMRTLTELLFKTGCDRAYVYQFHNGSVFSIQQPIWKVSCTHEVCAKGVAPEMHRLNNTFVSVVWGGIGAVFGSQVEFPGTTRLNGGACVGNDKRCITGRGIHVYEVNDMPEGSTKAYLSLQGTTKMVHVALLDAGGNPVGIVGVDYVTAEPASLEAICCNICQASSVLSLIFTGRYA